MPIKKMGCFRLDPYFLLLFLREGGTPQNENFYIGSHTAPFFKNRVFFVDVFLVLGHFPPTRAENTRRKPDFQSEIPRFMSGNETGEPRRPSNVFFSQGGLNRQKMGIRDFTTKTTFSKKYTKKGQKSRGHHFFAIARILTNFG